MFINWYIARPTYHFFLIYTCGLTVVIKRICYVMGAHELSSLYALLQSADHADIWISLPVRPTDSRVAFRRALKTHLFNIAFI